MGKNVGDDLAEGKNTLPLIFAMRDGTAAEKNAVASAVKDQGIALLPEVLSAINNTDALQKSLQVANEFADQAVDALQALPESEYKQALITIARYSVKRTS